MNTFVQEQPLALYVVFYWGGGTTFNSTYTYMYMIVNYSLQVESIQSYWKTRENGGFKRTELKSLKYMCIFQAG